MYQRPPCEETLVWVKEEVKSSKPTNRTRESSEEKSRGRAGADTPSAQTALASLSLGDVSSGYSGLCHLCQAGQVGF
ncbi:hypothetical protein R1sor_018805 [Riccia sorocarpa]|uniref:Uncharacterized protein n=1 Tax=Riccia sorocarpa TaxID=122646 RepID=A0ABD3IAT0_9MARC